MTRLTTAAAAAVLLMSAASVASAADPVPDMKGTWTGKTYTIVAGAGGHWPANQGTYDKPGLHEGELRLAINGQDGRRFWGVSTITAGGKATDEPFIGELHGKANRQVIVADTDGYFTGEVHGNVFSFCYAQAGLQQAAVVSCTEVKRAR